MIHHVFGTTPKLLQSPYRAYRLFGLYILSYFYVYTSSKSPTLKAAGETNSFSKVTTVAYLSRCLGTLIHPHVLPRISTCEKRLHRAAPGPSTRAPKGAPCSTTWRPIQVSQGVAPERRRPLATCRADTKRC